MKKTYPIKKNEYWNLLKIFIEDFGYPSYYEELVIYIEGKENFNVTLTREGLRWSWRDEKLNEVEDKYKKHNHSFVTNLKDLKEKILFITKYYGNKGHISIASVFRFLDNERNIAVEMRPKSLIGEIISIIVPNEAVELDDTAFIKKYNNFFEQKVKPHLGVDLLEKTSLLKNINEEFIHFNISESPILNTKIIDFCRDNGIMNPFKKECTYRELLSSKSNNYCHYEELFYQMTKIDLLSVNRHYSLPKHLKHKNISIIIPAYNSDSTINKVLSSIKWQKIESNYFENIEVIIIDDNSINDLSRFINIDDYPFNIQIIRLNNNHGISHARHLGVIHSSGDILFFLDSDVILSEYVINKIKISNNEENLKN